MPRLLRYAWAFFPGSLLGLIGVPLALLGGGRCRVVRGCVEIEGGGVTWFLRRGMRWLGGNGAAAMTLGHVILGCDQSCLDRSRDHEHVHVRQYERWGPFFLPAYLLAGLWLWWRGFDAYLDNPFEREAYSKAPRRNRI